MPDNLTTATATSRAVPQRPPPPGVKDIADDLDKHIDDMVEATLQAILTEVPIYRVRGDEVAADTRRAASYVYASFIETLRSGHPPNEAVAHSLANVGADRAAQGIPLGDLLQAFRIWARSAGATLHKVAKANNHDREAALWVAEAIMYWVDVISNLAAHDYTREQARMLRENEEERRSFLLDLLYGELAGETALERAENIGWEPAIEHSVAVVGTSECSHLHSTIEEDVAQRFPRSFVTTIRGEIVILRPSPTPDDYEDLVKSITRLTMEVDLCVGITRPRLGFTGVRQSYLEAIEALAIARSSKTTIVDYEEAVLDRILRKEPALLAELVEHTIAPLIEYDRTRSTDLVRTLETYFLLGQSPTRTAKILHTHPQTIRYRLNRIKEITNLSLEDPEDSLHLILGLRGKDILPHVTIPENKTRPYNF